MTESNKLSLTVKVFNNKIHPIFPTIRHYFRKKYINNQPIRITTVVDVKYESTVKNDDEPASILDGVGVIIRKILASGRAQLPNCFFSFAKFSIEINANTNTQHHIELFG